MAKLDDVVLRIVLVDDEPDDRALIERALLKEFAFITTTHVHDQAGLDAALAEPFDAIVTDYALNWSDGLAVLRQVRSRAPLAPVVMCTGSGTEELAVEGMQEGLDDYVVKGRKGFARVGFSLRSAVARRKLAADVAHTRGFLELLLSAVEQAPIAVLIAEGTERSTILYANTAAEGMFDRSRSVLLGTLLSELFQATLDAATLEDVQRGMGTSSAVRRRALVKRKGGLTHYDLRVDPVKNGHAAATHFFLTARDVSTELDLAARAVEVDRLIAVGEIAAGVAHEINNPLTYVLTGLELLLTTIGEKEKELVVDALDGANRIKEVVKDLSALSRRRAETGGAQLERSVATALNITTNQIEHRANLVKDLRAGPVRVRANDQRLVQVLINLLMNATQAIREGARGTVTARTFLEGERAIVEIEDDGVGIPPELMDRVFEPFVTTKPVGVGTGLGLSISRLAVGEMGGELTLSSVVGRGTTARISLQLERAAAAVEAHSVPAPPRSRLLFIDDEFHMLGLFRRLVGAAHDVECLGDGASALVRLRSGPPVDVIFCDLMMPGVSGRAVFEALEKELPELTTRFVVVTGGAFTPEAVEFVSRPGLRVLEKPYRARQVMELIAEVRAAHPTPR